MKRTTRMLILVGVLAIVIIGYTAISRLAAEDSATGTGGSAVSVFSINKDSVKEISWEYEDEEIAVEKVGSAWRYTGDSTFPLSLAKVDQMLTAISNVKASRAIEDVDSLAEYGLDKPSYRVRISNEEGLLVGFSIGDKNEITGDYYLKTDDSESIYLVDGTLPAAFGNTLLDVVQRETIPDMTTVDALVISTPKKTNRIVYMSTHKGITYTNAYKWFYEFDVDGNIAYAPLGTAKVNKLQNKIKNIVWEDCLEYNVKESELSAYGLDDPGVTITAEFAKGDFTLMLGHTDGDSYYAKTGDSGIVYLVSKETLDDITSADFETLRSDDVCLMEWETVDSMEITVDGKTSIIYFERPEEGSEVSFIVDGFPGNLERVDKLLRSINAMTSIDQTDNPSPFTEPEVRIVFHRNTEYFHTMVMSLYLYDSQSYLVEFDGQSRLLVGTEDVGELKEAFSSLLD